MWKSAVASAILGAPVQHAEAQRQAGAVGVASADSDPASVHMIDELAAAVHSALFRIQPVVGQGPVQNVADLLDYDIAAALVSADVLPYVERTGRLLRARQSLRYIAALDRADVHVLALASIASIEHLAGTRVNFGPPDSRASITASTIFDALGLRVQPTFLTAAAALQALQQRRITALVHVAPKPASLFFALNQSDGVHFLPVPQTPQLSSLYLASQLGIADYPLLIGQGEAGRGKPIPTVAVPIVIATANPAPSTERYRDLSLLTDALFSFAMVPQKGASASTWAHLDPSLDVPGWQRFPPAAARLQGQAAASQPEHAAPSASGSSGPRVGQSQQDRQKLFEEYMRWKETRSRSAQSQEEQQKLFEEYMRWKETRNR